MGWSKYKEDNRILLDDRLYIKHYDGKKSCCFEFFSCPYCNRDFKNKELMYSHIKSTHNIVHPILMIDGKIRTNEKDIYLSNVTSATLYLYSYNQDIYINDTKIELKEEIDITDELISILEKDGFVRIKFSDKCINLHKYSIQEIHNDEVSQIIDKWNEDTAKGKRIQKCCDACLNQAELHYLDGLYNYFWACRAEGQDKIKRYDDAYSILKSFSQLTPIANCVLKVISFRRNWLKKLDQLCNETNSLDEFIIVNDFFKNDIHNYPDGQEYDKRLYIEDDLQKNIDAIIMYSKGNLEGAKKYTLNNDPQVIQDANLRDRILLLKARIELKQNGFNSKVKRYYKEIQTQELIVEEKKMEKKYGGK